MGKLTNEQIIEICDKVIEKVKEYESEHRIVFLCWQIEKLLPINNYGEIYLYIPLFTYENAKENANAQIISDQWWDDFNYSDRIKFMEWIKSQYQNK